MRDEFKQDLSLTFNIDETNLKATKGLLDKLSSDFSIKLSDETIKSLDQAIAAVDKKVKVGGTENKFRSEWTKFTEAQKANGQRILDKYSLSTILNTQMSKLTSVITDVGSKIADTISQAWENLEELYSSSLLTNETTFDNAMLYGMNPSQSYAYGKAQELTGVTFENMWRATPAQIAKFTEAFDKYQDKYMRLYDSGFFETLQNFNWEMKEFTENIQFEAMKFFIDNKDVIQSFMKISMKAAEVIIKVLTTIGESIFGGSMLSPESIASRNESIINNYSTGASIAITNNFESNTSATDRGMLANAGNLVYKQTIESLK